MPDSQQPATWNFWTAIALGGRIPRRIVPVIWNEGPSGAVSSKWTVGKSGRVDFSMNDPGRAVELLRDGTASMTTVRASGIREPII